MHRFCMEKLKAWKNDKNRKPLLLDGARQVGKTWLLKELGRTCFKNTAYVSLDRHPAMRKSFAQGCDPKRLLEDISAATRQKILPEETLVIIDEIQSEGAAITSLKYFCEETPEYAVAAAGSLLGLSANFGSGYPVGKTDCIDVYPMTFQEFLVALGDEILSQTIDDCRWESLGRFREMVERKLRQYYYVGGMPAAVAAFSEGADFIAARREHKRILHDFDMDLAKHCESQRMLGSVRDVFRSIPSQLASDKGRFTFKSVREGGRGRDFIEAIGFLKDANLCHAIRNVSKPAVPLAAYATDSFKLYGPDVGLLAAMCGIEGEMLLERNAIFQEYKGALTEQYVQQELRSALDMQPFYWKEEGSTAEIDFLIQHSCGIVPIEVKAEVNLRAKSLRIYQEKYHPSMAVKISMTDYKESPGLVNLPLYGVSQLKKILDKSGDENF